MTVLKNEEELHDLIRKNPEKYLADINNSSCRYPIVLDEYNLGNKNIDFFLMDQDACPVLVECKLCKNPGSRGGITWQLLDYFANAKLISAKTLLERAKLKYVSDRVIEKKLDKPRFAKAKVFFEAVVSHIKKDKIRLVFYLDTIPDSYRHDLIYTVNFLKKLSSKPEIEFSLFELTDNQEPLLVDIDNLDEKEELDRKEKTVSLSETEKKKRKFFQNAFDNDVDYLLEKIIIDLAQWGFPLKSKSINVTFLRFSRDDLEFCISVGNNKLWLEPESEKLKRILLERGGMNKKIPVGLKETWNKLSRDLGLEPDSSDKEY